MLRSIGLFRPGNRLPFYRAVINFEASYSSKKKSGEKGTPILPASRKKKRPTKDYLKEDPFPEDKESFRKLQKIVDLGKATNLSADNPFKELMAEVKNIADQADRDLEKDDQKRAKRDRVDINTKKAKESWKATQKSPEEQQNEKLEKLGSAEAFSQHLLNKRKQQKETTVENVRDYSKSKFEKKTYEQVSKLSFNEAGLNQQVIFAPIDEKLIPQVEISDDLQQKVVQSQNEMIKLKDIIYPLKDMYETTTRSEYSSIITRFIESIDEENKAREEEIEKELGDYYEDKTNKGQDFKVDEDYQKELDEKIKDFERRTAETDPIIFGYAKDNDKFDPKDITKRSKEEKKMDLKISKKIKKKLKKSDGRKNKLDEDGEDDESDQLEYEKDVINNLEEDSDVPHSGLAFLDVPLTKIELELREEQREKREQIAEQKRIAELNDRGDTYITDVENDFDEDPDDIPKRRLRQQISEDLDNKEIEEALKDPKETGREKIRIEDGVLVVNGVAVPNINRRFVDEIYGRLPYRERRRKEKQLLREQLRLKRQQRRKNSQSSRYIYDGDSQYTRRQLQMSEYIRKYLQITLNLPQCRELDAHSFNIDGIIVNRELSHATVFWTCGDDFSNALATLVRLKPLIRKHFASLTSHLKISPNFSFVKREIAENLLNDPLEEELGDKYAQIKTDKESIDLQTDIKKFVDEPLTEEIKEEYSYVEPDKDSFNANELRELEEQRVKSLYIIDQQNLFIKQQRDQLRFERDLTESNLSKEEFIKQYTQYLKDTNQEIDSDEIDYIADERYYSKSLIEEEPDEKKPDENENVFEGENTYFDEAELRTILGEQPKDGNEEEMIDPESYMKFARSEKGIFRSGERTEENSKRPQEPYISSRGQVVESWERNVYSDAYDSEEE